MYFDFLHLISTHQGSPNTHMCTHTRTPMTVCVRTVHWSVFLCVKFAVLLSVPGPC